MSKLNLALLKSDLEKVGLPEYFASGGMYIRELDCFCIEGYLGYKIGGIPVENIQDSYTWFRQRYGTTIWVDHDEIINVVADPTGHRLPDAEMTHEHGDSFRLPAKEVMERLTPRLEKMARG